MAGFVVAPNTIKVNLHWTIHGRPQLNVLHGLYTTAGPLNPSMAQSIFNAIVAGTATNNAFFSGLATSTTFTAVGVLDERSADNIELVSTGTGIVGTATGKPLADGTSLVVTVRTAKTGRAHRGRIYSLGWSVDAMDTGGLCLQGFANAAVNWYTSVASAMAGQGATLAVKSTAKPDRPAHDGSTLPAKPYEITPFTVLQARDLIWDSNRRRTDTLHR